jgi:hypothetical protein
MKSACIKVRTLSWLNGLSEGNKFLSEAFEDGTDPGRKQSNHSVLSSGAISDRSQPARVSLSVKAFTAVFSAPGAVCRGLKMKIMGINSNRHAKNPLVQRREKLRSLSYGFDDAFAVLIWEYKGHKASFIVLLPG